MSLKEELVTTARKLIRDDGPDSLSLRDVARRLGISHQAYEVMFARPWPVVANAALKKSAQLAYDRLSHLLPDDPGAALFVWVVVHGLAGILNSPVLEGLDLGSREEVIGEVLGHVVFGILGTPPAPAPVSSRTDGSLMES